MGVGTQRILERTKLNVELVMPISKGVVRACPHMYESDCHGIEMIKDPTGKEWAIGGTNRPERWTHDPWCGLPIKPLTPTKHDRRGK